MGASLGAGVAAKIGWYVDPLPWSHGAVTSLIRPDASRYDEWRAMVEEFGAPHPAGSSLWDVPAGLGHDTFLAHVQKTRFAGEIDLEQFWIADGNALVGFIQLRRWLVPRLVEVGGHIGYSVRPSARRHGHATRALGLMLDHARSLCLERVLITCDDTNVASARTIEAHHGELEDVRKGTRRYWIRL